MQPNVRFDHMVVVVEAEGEVHVLVEMQAPDAPAVERPPIDVVVVLDRSGSMRGGPLESVIEATCGLLHRAGPDDRIGVVAFDDQVRVVLPLQHHDAAAASRAVRRLSSGGSTNLSGAGSRGWRCCTTRGVPMR